MVHRVVQKILIPNVGGEFREKTMYLERNEVFVHLTGKTNLLRTSFRGTQKKKKLPLFYNLDTMKNSLPSLLEIAYQNKVADNELSQ